MKQVDYEKNLKNLKNNISGMKQGGFNQIFLISFYSLNSYFKSIIAFGRKHPITKDNLNIIKEVYQIFLKERKLLNFILKNIGTIDINEAANAVYMLDELNDETIMYYYEVIEDIEDACDIKDERRGKRKKSDTPTLLETNVYTNEVIALAENDKSLRKFLKFDEKFWELANTRIIIKEDNQEGLENVYYAKAILDENDFVEDFRIIIPKVVNLNTALIAIKVYKEAYSIYKNIGKLYEPFNDDEAFETQREFEEEYLLKKAIKRL